MTDWSVLGLPATRPRVTPTGTSAPRRPAPPEADRAGSNDSPLRRSPPAAATWLGRRLRAQVPRRPRRAPGEIGKLAEGYHGCGSALATYAGSLAEAKARAGTALRQGDDADARYQGRHARAPQQPPRRPRRADVLRPGPDPDRTRRRRPPDWIPPPPRQVTAAAARARSADADREAARHLADQAAALRDDAETRCVDGIDAALDGSGIKDKPWWQRAWDAVTAPFRSWDAFVDLCRKVAWSRVWWPCSSPGRSGWHWWRSRWWRAPRSWPDS